MTSSRFDTSYIDRELDDYIEWHGSHDSASSTDFDRRLDDDAAGAFDYYGDVASRLPLLPLTALIAAARARGQTRFPVIGRPEPSFDCPPIPGAGDDIVLRIATRHGIDGYAAAASIGLTYQRLGRSFAVALLPSIEAFLDGIRQIGESAARFAARYQASASPRADETQLDRALRLRQTRNTGPALPGMDGRIRR